MLEYKIILILSIFYNLTQILKFYLTYCICKLNYFDVLCNIYFKEHLPEDGHHRWPKNIGG